MAINFDPTSIELEDIYSHLKHNSLNFDNNCHDKLSQDTYYCIECKQSVCIECGIQLHKDKQHKLIPKEKVLFYDDTFLSSVDNSIQNALTFQQTKTKCILDIENKINTLHGRIEQIKQEKLSEINKVYSQCEQSINELQVNFQETKNKLKEYYKSFTNFFAIKENNNDINNTLFLMNYEIIAMLNNQNKKLFTTLKNQQDEFISYKNEALNQIDIIYNDIDNITQLKLPNVKLDDFYWDIKSKIKSFEDNIKTVQKIIYDIYRKNGSYELLNDLVSILDTKSKKGIDYIFNHNIFTQMNIQHPKTERDIKEEDTINISNNNTNVKMVPHTYRENNNTLIKTPLNERKFNLKSPKTRSHSKNNKQHSNYQSHNNSISSSTSKNYTPLSTGKHNNSSSKKYIKNHLVKASFSSSKKNSQTNSYNNIFDQFNIKSPSEIILDNKIKQSFYTYSVIDMYNKLFRPQPRHSIDSSTKIFDDYNQRQHLLKDTVKPVIGTSDILIYDSSNNKTIRKKLLLNKEQHGYTLFPHGVRHIFINGKLYITGGVDVSGNAINTVLLFDVETYEIQQITPMNEGHCYHSIELLDNYNCIIVIGGERNKTCELFDLFTLKWTRLPNLTYPRANVNIYYDHFTSDVYAMFGVSGVITTQKGFSDVIEVLELKDISGGWIKVDYSKSATINLKIGYVSVIPYTSDKLLIKGCKSAKAGSLLMNNALFLMKENEIVKVSQEILDEMKIKETKTKNFTNNGNVVKKIK